MIFVKLAILLWVAFLIARFFFKANLSREDYIRAAIGLNPKITFGRILFVAVFLLALADSFAALVWFLFFR